MKPLNIKLSVLICLNSCKLFFNKSLPLLSSLPMFNNATVGFSFLNTALYKAAPNLEKSTKFFILQSILAPKSKTTLSPLCDGHIDAKAGLSIPFMVSRINLDMTNKAAVFPADMAISAFLFFKAVSANHILEFFPFLTASNGDSLSDTFSLV